MFVGRSVRKNCGRAFECRLLLEVVLKILVGRGKKKMGEKKWRGKNGGKKWGKKWGEKMGEKNVEMFVGLIYLLICWWL